MATQAQLKASAKYDKANTKSIFLKLNIKTDADVLQYLETVGNKQGYIKELIRKDMNGSDEQKNKIIEGSFTEGDLVTVLINGEKHTRKVKFNKKLNEAVITVLGIEHAASEFN